MIKILIVDDHAVVRRGLKQILSDEPDMAVCGEAPDTRELAKIVDTQNWDIIILDITLTDGSGLDVLSELKRKHPLLPVLILSVHPEEQYAIRALKSGADGYVNKRCAPEELVNAVRKVVSGGKFISPVVAERLAYSLREGFKQPLHETLSNREYQVTCMIASGKTLKQIALELYLSVKTVRTYRQRIMEKMKFRSNAELIHYAIKKRLVD
jgi:two-component system invasion response regulator UvrY